MFRHSAWLPYEQTAYDAYDQIERRFDELDAWTRQEHPEYADRQWGIASRRLYATKKTRFINDVLRRSFPDARTACELGFMAGHSALLFLETLPQARIYSFDDLWDGPWALRNADRIATLYPGRFELIIGNSAETVPAFSSRGIQCDVVFVDGSKEAAHRRNDMAVFRKLASQNAVVFLDEVSSAACICGDSACHGDYSAISEMYLSLVKEEQLYILECVDTITKHDSFCAATFHPPALAPNDAAPDPDPPAPAASPASLPALPATVVSGYWDVASKHSPQAYRAWFNNTLRINAGMIFFFEDEAVRRFVAHVRRGLHTVFIQLALSDFAATQLYNPAWVHEMHVPTPELSTIWLEKVFLVQRAARANPFNSSWFAWMDAGCAACRERPPGDELWPAERALAQLPRDRVIYTHVDAWYHHFAGTAFMYHADMVTPVRERFENEARRCAATLNAWPCGNVLQARRWIRRSHAPAGRRVVRQQVVAGTCLQRYHASRRLRAALVAPRPPGSERGAVTCMAGSASALRFYSTRRLPRYSARTEPLSPSPQQAPPRRSASRSAESWAASPWLRTLPQAGSSAPPSRPRSSPAAPHPSRQ